MIHSYILLGMLSREIGLKSPLSELFPFFGTALTLLIFDWEGNFEVFKLSPKTQDKPTATASPPSVSPLAAMPSGPHPFPGFTRFSITLLI